MDSNTQLTRRVKGTGTIEPRKHKSSGCSYIVKVPDGYRFNKRGQKVTKYKKLKLCHSQAEAIAILDNYNAGFKGPEFMITTFEELYRCWIADHKKNGYSESAIRTIEAAYKYCSSFYRMDIRSIGPEHLRYLLNTASVCITLKNGEVETRMASDSVKARIKSICNLMFDYALERSLIERNPARIFSANSTLKAVERNRTEKEPLCIDAIKKLWQLKDEVNNIDMILISLYTGYRPKELTELTVDQIDLENKVIIAGMKTVNGINRHIPIHPAIYEMVEKRYYQSIGAFNNTQIFHERTAQNSTHITYDKYRKRFQKIMEIIGYPQYTPDCTRHTFATQTLICDVNSSVRTRVMGHSINGNVTEKYYVHLDDNYLYQEMLKLSYCPEFDRI